MIEAGSAPNYPDNVFILTQFHIADSLLTGEIRQYALYRIMLMQINIFGIDNAGSMYRKFRQECTDPAYLRSVSEAWNKTEAVYRQADKTVYKVVGSDSLDAYIMYPGTRNRAHALHRSPAPGRMVQRASG